jgi:hypothetical protein
VAGDLIADYLARLGAGLPDSRGARQVIEEVSDGLRAAADDHAARGAGPLRAAELAVAEFGEPGDLAADFVPVLTAAEAHRDGVAFLVTGPMIGVFWLAAAVLTSPAAPVAVGAGMAAVGVVLASAVPRAVYGVAVTGRLGRRLVAPPAAAARAVAGAVRTAVVLDAALVLLALPALALLSRSALPAALATVAALLSLARIVAATRVTRRLDRLRTLPA